MIVGEGEGFLKLIFSLDDMQLLGVHVIGEQATELVHVGLMALMYGGAWSALHTRVFQLSDIA